MFLNELIKILKTERARSFGFWCVGLIITDQVLKWLVFSLVIERAIWRWGNLGLVGVEQHKNFLFAFSLPLPTVLMYGIYAVSLIVMIYYVAKNFQSLSRPHMYAWAIILAGALSNVGERAWLGYVRDFIYVIGGGILNPADFYIISGVIVLLFTENRQKNL